MVDTRGYPYASDVGVRSIEGLIELGRSSGVPFSVSSSYRANSTTFHGTENAIDAVSSQKNMTELAAYLYQFWPFLAELEHTNPDGSGYWVDNGQKKDAQFFGAHDYEAHRTHVHYAATMSGLRAAYDWSQKQKQAGRDPTKTPLPKPDAPVTTAQKLGCLTKPVATIILLSPLVYTLVR